MLLRALFKTCSFGFQFLRQISSDAIGQERLYNKWEYLLYINGKTRQEKQCDAQKKRYTHLKTSDERAL